MNRRNFIKTTMLVSAALASGRAVAGEYSSRSAEGISRLTNRGNPSVLEQKHVPGIDAPAGIAPGVWFDVKVKVGFMKGHPSTPEHWITLIKLLVDGKEVAAASHAAGGVSDSTATFRIRLEKSATIEAVEHCNLHGTWISDPVKIMVS